MFVKTKPCCLFLFVFTCISIIHTESAEKTVSVPHWTQRRHPGEVVQDLWGWDYAPEHYRYIPPYWAGPKETWEELADSADWGANLVDVCYGFYRLGNEAYNGVAEPSRAAGLYRENGVWTLQDNFDLNYKLHRRGMMIHWIPNCMPPDDFEKFIDWNLTLAEEQFDTLNLGWGKIQDGIGREQQVVFPPGLANYCFLPFHPGHYQYFAESRIFSDAWPNAPMLLSTGGAAHDEKTPPKGFGAGMTKRNGSEYACSHIEAVEEVGLDGACGFAHPDWIQKTLHDTLRPSYKDLRNKSYAAFWYIMSSPGAQTPATHFHSLAMGIDPIRSAWAGKLEATGKDGRKEIFRREEFPASTGYIQNNYLRLYAFAEQSGGKLLYDPERAAHFTDMTQAKTLVEDFLATVVGEAPTIRDIAPVDYQFEEPGGFWAKMTTKARWVTKSGTNIYAQMMKSEEKRTYSTVSDSPFLRVEMEFLQHGTPAEYGSRMNIPHYDLLEIEGKLIKDKAEVELAPALILKNSKGDLPALALLVTSTKPTKVKFTPGQTLTLWYGNSPREHKVDLIACVLDGLYKEQDLPALAKALRENPEELRMESGQTLEIKNPHQLPLVKVLKLSGAHERPYLVNENGWWMARGAQKCLSDPQQSYLKLYLPPNGTARLRPMGCVAAEAKPGWGCQYTLALKDVVSTPTMPRIGPHRTKGARCRAEVLRVNSFVFAPRVEFAQPIQSARLNGKPWHYFDDMVVFLPNSPGEYNLEVEYGRNPEPHVTCTWAVVEETNWDGKQLTLKTALPPWMKNMPEDSYLAATIKHPELFLNGIDGGQLLRAKRGTGSVIRFYQPEAIKLTLDNDPANDAPRAPNLRSDIEAYLSREQARDVTPFIGPRTFEMVNLRDVASGKADLTKYGALVWNNFYLDKLPQISGKKEVVDQIKKYVSGGGGLMLLSRAVPYVNTLGIESVPAGRDQRFTNSAWGSPVGVGERKELTYGCIPVDGATSHSLFNGIAPRENNYLPLVFVNWMSVMRAKGWEATKPPKEGKTLATFFSETEKENPATPAIVEWEVGEGRVLASCANLHWSFTSRDLWPHIGPFTWPPDAATARQWATQNIMQVNQNGAKFMQNALDYVSRNKMDKPVGLICWSASQQ